MNVWQPQPQVGYLNFSISAKIVETSQQSIETIARTTRIGYVVGVPELNVSSAVIA